MAKDHPFTFLDHSIKCGDSLVGLTNRQIAAFHWDPTQAKDRVFGQEKLEQQIAKVAEQRKRILDWTEDTESAVLKKRDFLAAADSAAASLKTTGDLVIAAYFAGEKPKQRQQNRDEFLHRHLELQKGENIAQNLPWQVQTLNDLRGISSPSSHSTSNIQNSKFSHPIRPFHWEIEFPEVFYRENPGFDAIVGNPPFLGGKRISAAFGDVYLSWLMSVNDEANGSADFVTYFFRKSYTILGDDATLGLLATNTISQGDTRFTGLRWILNNGGVIYNATRRIKWPGVAQVIVSLVNIFKGSFDGKITLDQKPVKTITAFLLPNGPLNDPLPIAENKTKSYQGPIVLGMGFTFDDGGNPSVGGNLEKMRQILNANPSASEIIKPYIGGAEFGDSPTQSPRRYVIDFGLRSESECKAWPELYEIVEKSVKPERALSKRDSYRNVWWQFAEPQKSMLREKEGLSRVLMHPFTSTYVMFAFIPSSVVIAGPQYVICFETWESFCVLQARLHELWVRLLASTMGDGQRYAATDTFETFPFPPDWETNEALEEAGRSYYEYRAALMVRNDEGLTKTYNRFHDPEERSPEIQQLRALHAAMDRAVLAAYGWPDIPTACEFLLDYEEDDDEAETTGKKRQKKKPYRLRWPDEIRDEVLARLLALNAERAAQERLAGTGKATGKKAAKKQPTNRPKRDDEMI
jgi:hypothetical protein